MKLLMDADCLIKLTKAGAKEAVCRAFDVFLPQKVKEEVIDRGMEKRLADAEVMDQNLKKKLLSVRSARGLATPEGEQEAVSLFQQGGYDAIGTDDRRFIGRLRTFSIPYVTPAVVIVLMAEKGALSKKEARLALNRLAEFISDAEYLAAGQLLNKET